MRSTITLAVLALVVAAGSPAVADDFGGWRFTVPAGYSSSNANDALVLQKVTPPTYCLIILYPVRAMSHPLATEAATDWKTYVEAGFKTADVKHHGDGTTKSSLAFYATAGTLQNDANRVSGILYTIATGRSVSSVLLSSNNADTITGCRAALTTFLDSLALAPVAAAQPAQAPPSAVAGRWASSASSDSASWGSGRRQYVFAADGTYTFYSELWGGKYNSKVWRLVSESGTYTVDGDKLTIAPAKTNGIEKNGTKTTPFKVAVEKVTYTWQRHYFEGIQEWQIILTTPTKTARDGEFANNDQFPSSYMYSSKYAPDWTNPP